MQVTQWSWLNYKCSRGYFTQYQLNKTHYEKPLHIKLTFLQVQSYLPLPPYAANHIIIFVCANTKEMTYEDGRGLLYSYHS